jgi:hypothetical protein
MALDGAYPLSTQDGKAIPLDIIKPLGVLSQAFGPGVATDFDIPEDYEIGIVFATEDCFVSIVGDNLAALMDNTIYENTVFVPARTAITIVLTDGVCYVRGTEASGSIYMQFIEKWAAFGLETQFVRK